MITAPVAPPSARLVIAIADPLEHASEIKEFFVVNGLPSFPDYFDRTYPAAVIRGATAWLGRDERGRLVMYQACFPRQFRFGGRDVTAGLMVNLMVAEAYRAFFPALALERRVVRDLQARGDIDFLYADPTEPSRLLLRASGFVVVGTLRRFVFPTADRRPLVEFGVRALHAYLRTSQAFARGMVVETHPAAAFPMELVAVPPDKPACVTAYHDVALYRSRVPGYPGADDWWLTGRAPGSSGPPDAALLLCGPDASGVARLRVARWAAACNPAAVFPPLIAELRQRGCRRLEVSTLEESQFARVLARSGFFPRSERVPVVARAFTALGEACMRSVRDWEITDVECDR